jgi:hypothetical protein
MPLPLPQDMIAAAARARAHLRQAADHVAGFVAAHLNDDGGFRGRSAASDLFYTAYALDCLAALGAPLPAERTAGYLRAFGRGRSLDLVHLVSLVRCRSRLGGGDGAPPAAELLAGAERFRRADGGYATAADAGGGSPYGCFLAMTAYEDAGEAVPDAPSLLRCIDGLRTADGAWANEPALRAGSTSATAAAAVLHARIAGRAPREAVAWLRARRDAASGGFLANPAAAAPDLLSTATALYALAAAGDDIGDLRAPGLRFVEGLWVDRGGFCGSWADAVADCEYTFYGLLAIGCLMPAASPPSRRRRTESRADAP